MKTKPLTFTIHIGGKQVDKLTEEQLEKMSQRLSEAMSLYYTAHPQEYANLKNKEYKIMIEKVKNVEIILETLAERIKELKLDVYLKDLRIKELEQELAEAKEGKGNGKD